MTNNAVFIIKPEIWAAALVAVYKAVHLILIEIHKACVLIIFFIVEVIHTIFTAAHDKTSYQIPPGIDTERQYSLLLYNI